MATQADNISDKPGTHHGKNSDTGEFLTVKNADDGDVVRDHGPDSFFVSYGTDEGHVSQVYDGDGNIIVPDKT